MVQAKDKTRRVRERSGRDSAWPNHRGQRFRVPRDSKHMHAHNHSPDLYGTHPRPIINGMFAWWLFESSINRIYGSIKIHGSTIEVIFMCLLGVLGDQQTCLSPQWQSNGA